MSEPVREAAEVIRANAQEIIDRPQSPFGGSENGDEAWSWTHEYLAGFAEAALALLADRDRLAGEVERLRDRAVCSGCGQDTDEGGSCETPGCDLVPGGCEMIPSSDLPGALREAMERHNEERSEWREECILAAALSDSKEEE